MTRWLGWVGIAAALCACGDAAHDAGDSSDDGAASQTTQGGGDDDASDSTTSVGGSASGGQCDDTSAGLELSDDGGGGDDEGTSGGGSAEDTGAGMGGDIPIGATVFAVREGFVPAGTLVELTNVVVTAPVVPTTLGSMLFVQAPEGGEYSAITVSVADLVDPMPLGTRVRIVGRVGWRGDLTEIVVAYEDLQGVIAVGTGELPPPFVIQAADLADPTALLEPYDAALVRVETPEVVDDDPCPGEFAIAADLRIDDLFLGELAPTPATGSEFSAIVGALRDTGNGFEIAPRSLDDLVE